MEGAGSTTGKTGKNPWISEEDAKKEFTQDGVLRWRTPDTLECTVKGMGIGMATGAVLSMLKQISDAVSRASTGPEGALKELPDSLAPPWEKISHTCIWAMGGAIFCGCTGFVYAKIRGERPQKVKSHTE